jgi:glycosyltransferase involved in cell wall biosynthesis
MSQKEKSMSPKVTVFVPTFNYARYLSETIESILSQDFEDFELIISDDCSTDNTEDVCLRYVEQDSRVRFFRQNKNLGMVENWNWCMRTARGEYLKPMLADDKFSKPYALSRLVESLDSNRLLSLSFSARTLIDERSNLIGILNPLGDRNRIYKNGVSLTNNCMRRAGNMIGEPSAALFRREDVARGFDESYRQLVDLDMWFHLLQKGGAFYYSEPLCCFRIHALQQTNVNRESKIHLDEMWRLSDYVKGKVKYQLQFRHIYRLKKAMGSNDQKRVDSFREELCLAEYLYGYFWYRFSRVFENIARCVRKIKVG